MSRWFHFCFRLHLAGDGRPLWWLDLALLDSIVRRAKQEQGPELELWRVHRRCNPQDDAGHQFTFLAYTMEDVATRIDNAIRHSEMVGFLEENGLLREYLLVREDGDDIHRVEGTSDKSWPQEIQCAWPYYIMGASQMLLDLVYQLKRGSETPDLSEGVGPLEVHYNHIATLMTGMWQEFGSHSYLHHLNALFGYQPLLVRPRSHLGELMTL